MKERGSNSLWSGQKSGHPTIGCDSCKIQYMILPSDPPDGNASSASTAYG